MPATLNTPLSSRFTEAVGYALVHHRNQARKGGQIPYASHLLAVASIVLDMETSEDEAIAALLHDVIEDGGGSQAEAVIRDRFGDDVAEMVLANSDSTTGSDSKAPWRERKEAYIAAIPGKDIRAVRVSIADKLHNARAIVADYRRHGDELWTRFDESSDPGWYYGALIEAFESRRGELGKGGAAALDELGIVVQELRGYAVFASKGVERADRQLDTELVEAERGAASSDPSKPVARGEFPTQEELDDAAQHLRRRPRRP